MQYLQISPQRAYAGCMVRLYFNAWDEKMRWSLDHGPGTLEEHADQVIIAAPMITRLDPGKRGSTTEPAAWLESSELADYRIEDDTAVIWIPFP